MKFISAIVFAVLHNAEPKLNNESLSLTHKAGNYNKLLTIHTYLYTHTYTHTYTYFLLFKFT